MRETLKTCAGHTVAISGEHRFQVVVCSLPMQDNRRLSHISTIKRKVPGMIMGA